MTMKHNIVKSMIVALALGSATLASAQTLRSSYFMEGMNYRHQLNPAFAPESSYLNLPFFVLGNFNVGLQGNIGVNDFLYKYNQNGYNLTTFMNPMVGNAEFLDNLHKHNHLNTSVSVPVISFGFYKWNGFNTFDIGVRSNTSISLPYGLFDFMKTGMSDEAGTYYNAKDVAVRSNNYVEIALGHSHIINKDLTIGGKFKFLVGAGNVNARIKNMDIYMSGDKWDIYADGYMEGSLKGGEFKTKEPNDKGQREVDGFKVKNAGVGGFGVAVDLGAVYKMDDYVEGLSLSAALLDLGFICWNNALRANMMNSYTFEGFKHPVAVDPEDGDPGDINDQLDQIGDDLKDFYRFYEDKSVSKRTTKLATTMNIGAEYVLPYYKNLKFGLLSTTYFNKPFTWTEARISANVAPLSWFEASVNYGISSFGSSLGWVLNFHPNGFNFFIGSDHMITKVTPQYVPVGNANMNVCLGFNITWGKNKTKEAKNTTMLKTIVGYY